MKKWIDAHEIKSESHDRKGGQFGNPRHDLGPEFTGIRLKQQLDDLKQ